MKILFVTEYLPPRVSGIAERCQQYINGFRARGHIVEVWSVGGTVLADKYMWSIGNHWNPDQRVALGSYGLLWSASTGDWDVIHIVTPLNMSIYPLLSIAKLRGIRTYVSYHVNLLGYAAAYFSGPISKYAKTATTLAVQYGFHRYVEKLCDVLGVPSETPLQDFPVRPKVVHVMKCGVDMERFRPAASHPEHELLRLTYVGRLAPEKNIDFLVNAMQHSLLAKAELHLVGDGPQRKDLEELVEGLGLRGRVIFHGMQRGASLITHYQSADVVVTASETETFGFTVVESMACSSPVVLPSAGSFPEVYPMLREEWMFAPGDVEKYARLCLKAKETPKLREWVREQVKAHYSWQAAVDDMLATYKTGKPHGE